MNKKIKYQAIFALSAFLMTISSSSCLHAGVIQYNAGAGASGPGSETSVKTFEFEKSDMYTPEKMESDINILKQKYEGINVDSIGNSVDGRSIYRISVGNPNADKKILVIASIHAREYITTPLVMRQLKEILDKRASGDTTLNDINVQFVPMANPDGVIISQGVGFDGLVNESSKQKVKDIIESWSEWELKENKDKYDWFLNKWKNNVNGVDLNHNFPTKGWPNRPDTRGRASNEFYKGPSGGSEPETQAMMKLANEQNFSAVLNYHAQGQIIYWSNMHASDEVLKKNRAMADIAKKHTGYALVDPSMDGSRFGTGFKDWLDGEKGIPNITLEVGLGTSPVEEYQIETIWQQNEGLLPDIMNYVLGRYSS